MTEPTPTRTSSTRSRPARRSSSRLARRLAARPPCAPRSRCSPRRRSCPRHRPPTTSRSPTSTSSPRPRAAHCTVTRRCATAAPVDHGRAEPGRGLVDRRHLPVGPRARDRVHLRHAHREGDPGADGLVLFLADGRPRRASGRSAPASGTPCRREATQGGGLSCDLPGVPGGFAGIAIDRYGNFSGEINGSGPGPAGLRRRPRLRRRRDRLPVRRRRGRAGRHAHRRRHPADGPGDARARHGGRARDDRPARGRARSGPSSTACRCTVTARRHCRGRSASASPAPRAATWTCTRSTGSASGSRRTSPSSRTSPPHSSPGSEVEYTVTARNVGPNASAPSDLRVEVPDGLRDVAWRCSAAAGSRCGADSGSGAVRTEVDLPRTARRP